MKNHKTIQEEVAELRIQLAEANEAILAIRSGQVDALVVENEDGHQLFTLRSADQTYRIFIEKMKEGAVTLNEQEVIVYANSQFAAMLGLPLESVIGMRLSAFIPSAYEAFFEVILRSGWESDSRGELILIDHAGNHIPIVLSCTSLQLDEGKALSIIFTDLSVQKENERQLKLKNEQLEEAREKVASTNAELEAIVTERSKELLRSKEHFKFLSDNLPVIIWTAGTDGTITYANNKWYEYSGMSARTFTPQQLLTLVHPDEKLGAMAAWRESLDRKKGFTYEFRLKRASDGAYRWHSVNSYPFMDELGNVLLWIGTMTDIQNQKTELEKKDEFIGIASHELRTPLTSLKGYLQLMDREAELAPRLKTYVSKANTATGKLHRLVNDLLDVSKIQAGKLQFTTTVVDMTRVVRNCAENCEHIYPGLQVEKFLSQDCFVVGNEERLEQVLMNLISNAVKYAGINKTIRIDLTKSADEVEVSVTDKGIGLSKEDQQKVFERFYRVKDKNFTTSGLGMGLFIASEIIREHKGRMNVNSILHEGSVFSFTIPAIKENSAIPQQ